MSETQLYKRVCTVTVKDVTSVSTPEGGNTRTVSETNVVTIKDLRTSFVIKKSLTKEPNTMELQIYNLSADTRGRMKAKGSQVTVTAGYENTQGVIFIGDSRTIDHVKDGADWITKIRCGDGEVSYTVPRINESLAPGTSFKDAVRKAAAAMGVNLGNLEKFLTNTNFKENLTQFKNGLALSGRASQKFDELIKLAEAQWSIQDGKLQVLKDKGTEAAALQTVNTNAEAVVLSAKTGLIGSPDHGSPEQKKKVSIVKARSLLRYEFKCGGQVFLDALGTNRGYYKITHLTHDGDTMGGDWYTNLELKPL